MKSFSKHSRHFVLNPLSVPTSGGSANLAAPLTTDPASTHIRTSQCGLSVTCQTATTHTPTPVGALTVAWDRALYSASILVSLPLVSSRSSWMFSVCFFCISNFSCSTAATAACSWKAVQSTRPPRQCHVHIFFLIPRVRGRGGDEGADAR